MCLWVHVQDNPYDSLFTFLSLNNSYLCLPPFFSLLRNFYFLHFFLLLSYLREHIQNQAYSKVSPVGEILTLSQY